MESAPVKIEPLVGLPDHNIPTIFADGVANIANSRSVVKMVLYRTDPVLGEEKSFQNVAVGQLVLTMDSFAGMVALFEAAIGSYKRQGIIDEDHYEEAKAAFAERKK
jgi:hypothetical protein